MGKRVLCSSEITNAGILYLKERGYDVSVMRGTDLNTVLEDAKGCEGVLVRGEKMPAEVVKKLPPSVKVVARHGIGVDSVDVDALTECGIILTNAPLGNVNAVAEHALAMMIALAKGIVSRDKMVRSGDYRKRNDSASCDLEGKTLGIIGVGRIGTCLAQKCRYGLSMNVVGFDLFVQQSSFPPEVEFRADILDVFKEADFISLHVPLTKDSERMIGEAHLKAMKKSAFLINTARGGIIDDNALLKALRENTIAGAGIDAWAKEPPDDDDPFFALENVVLSPHIGGITHGSFDRMGIHAAMGIDEVLSGKKISFPVNAPAHPRIAQINQQ